MADIDVVKKRSSLWPWIIGIVLLLVVLWLVASVMNRQNRSTTSPTSQLYPPQGAAVSVLT